MHYIFSLARGCPSAPNSSIDHMDFLEPHHDFECLPGQNLRELHVISFWLIGNASGIFTPSKLCECRWPNGVTSPWLQWSEQLARTGSLF